MKAATYYSSALYLLSLVLAPLMIAPTFANENLYVVYMGVHSHGANGTSTDFERATQFHYHFLGSFLGSTDKAKDAISYSYNKHINGFAAILNPQVASKLAEHPKVVSVFLSQVLKLQTTRSWDFLGLENHGIIRDDSAWKLASFGKDAIIGNIDTGVWPESKSFHDDDIGPIPKKWRGIFQKGSDKSFKCNSKLIGARYFNKRKLVNATYDSPRDKDGHGTHTLSTAGGTFADGANVFGLGNGTAKGGSPGARVAAYKACRDGDEVCDGVDILAAFDMAIHDGVDVLSVSIGGDPTPFEKDVTAIGSFHAVSNGIVVVSAAGNTGPYESTVTNLAPWMITVAASSIDRQFPSYVILGNKMKFRGGSLSDKSLEPGNKLFPIISARNAKAAKATGNDAKFCKPGSLEPNVVRGKILVCSRGVTPRLDKGRQAALAGAVGMVLVNDQASGNEIIDDTHVLPATHINYKDGLDLLAYINSTRSPLARITKPTTELGTTPAPSMAAFSSQGPNSITPEIFKPDITAPGMNIIAAYTEAQGPSGLDFDKRLVKFNIMSGTSMSCPHIAGIVGLLKTLHPNWSPAAIKSALMTTASTLDNTWESITNASNMPATPFSFGGGHVQPNLAMNPGLVYDLTIEDYLDFLCALGYNNKQIKLFSIKPYACPAKAIKLTDLNYPAIAIPSLRGTAIVTRKVTNVGTTSSTYHALVHSPPGMSVQIEPKTLMFRSTGEVKDFTVVIRAKKKQGRRDNGYVFGQLKWCDLKHNVTIPIAVKQI